MPETGVQSTLEDFLDLYELAWAAGFFDGEGTFCLKTMRSNGSEYKYPVVQIAQNEALLLDRFQRAVKVGAVHWDGSRDVAVYRANKFEQVQFVACVLWPWLGRFKKEQAVRTLRGVRYGSRGGFYGYARLPG